MTVRMSRTKAQRHQVSQRRKTNNKNSHRAHRGTEKIVNDKLLMINEVKNLAQK